MYHLSITWACPTSYKCWPWFYCTSFCNPHSTWSQSPTKTQGCCQACCYCCC
ncbi:hypothetical protein H4I96_07254 [Botrytis cinerea]